MPVFLVRAHLPDLRATDLDAVVARVATASEQLNHEGFRIRCLHSTYVPTDGWLGCLYQADTHDEVRLATESAVMPFDDIVEAVIYGGHAAFHQGGKRSNAH